jgi:CO/xanthine dehydrogenase Mo-binding subunit
MSSAAFGMPSWRRATHDRPFATHPEAARAPDASLVHPDVPGNLAMDVERAFAEADVVVRERFETERAAGAAIEPRGVMAEPGGEEGSALTVWTSSRAPHIVRRALAGMRARATVLSLRMSMRSVHSWRQSNAWISAEDTGY